MIINVNFYIDSLSKAVGVVSKQVYLERFKFSSADLQKLVRSACNSEQIVFDNCRFDLEDVLDFGTDIHYNTESLSIDCKNNLITNKGLHQDFSNFSKVVDAIAMSGLKHSLTKIYIKREDYNVVAEAQRLLNAKGMKHISVNEKSIQRTTS